MINKLSAISAWVLLCAIAFVTLSPIDMRPQTGHDAPERVLSFMALGLAYGVGYPRRLWLAITATLAAAIGLEIAQLLVPGRHARLPDIGEKLAGGFIGLTIAVLWLAFNARHRRETSSA